MTVVGHYIFDVDIDIVGDYPSIVDTWHGHIVLITILKLLWSWY